MKTKTPLFYLWSFIFGLFLSPMPCALSQIPQGFNYQAIARDGTGAVLQNTPLQAMMYVQSESTGGTIFWKELHGSVTTNSFGLFTLIVGTGTRQTESTVATFNLIDWSVPSKYLKTEIYYSGSWKDMGTSQLLTVPYAMVAEDLAGSVAKLSVEGEATGFEDALFEVKNKNGQTIFAVYNEGVRIYVDDGAKGPKGGFSVGGFDMTKATKREYFVVSDDSVRIYLDNDPLTKGLKGGFAVGGYDMTKATDIEDYLQVTRDSTRIYVNEGSGKALKGGFAVGGFDMTKGTQTITPFTSLTTDNYLIGHEAGKRISSGLYNSFIGYNAGKNTTTGNSNTFIGYQSGFKNITGQANLYIGYQAGFAATTGDASQFIGYMSGYSNTTGTVNTFVGTYSGLMNTKGSFNTYVGNNAGGMDSLGRYNAFYGYETGSMSQGSWDTYIGSKSGNENINGNYNSFLGTHSGGKSTGSNNVFLGYNSGNLSDASGSVYLGYYSGHNFDRSNSLVISNSDASPYDINSLIYGEFDNKMVRINGFLQLPYNSGNSVLNMKMGNGNSILFKPEGDLIRIQSDHTGNPTLFWFDKTGQFGIGSSLSVGAGLSIGGALSVTGGLSLGGSISVAGGLSAAVSSGMVGIGISTPSYLLHVHKSPASAAWLSTFQNGNTSVQLAYGTGAGIFVNTNNTSSSLYGLDVYNGSNHVLYARNDGRVGIGTGVPGFNLDVIGRSRFQSGGGSAGFWLTNATNSADRAFFGMLDDNNVGFYGSGSASWPLTLNVNTGNVSISPKSGSSAGLTINSGATNSLVVTGNSYLFGNMGINSNPNAAYGLIVSGGSNFALYANGKVYSTGTVGIGTYPDNNYGLQVYGGTVASIMASGNLIVGNNTIVYGRLGVGTSSPNIKLDVSGMIRAMGAEAPTSGAGLELSFSGGVGYVETYDRTNNLQKPLCLAATNVYPWQQVNLGNSTNKWNAVYAANGTIQTSDLRLKENILPLKYGIETLMQLKPISFIWKNSNDKQTRLGLIAQDVLPLISEIVDIGTDTEATLGINYSELTPVLIKAIQEQQQQIESTKQENQQLKSEVQSLKDKMDRIEAMLAKGDIR